MRAVPDPNVLSAAPWLKSAKEMCPAESDCPTRECAEFYLPGLQHRAESIHHAADVCFWYKADTPTVAMNLRFWE